MTSQVSHSSPVNLAKTQKAIGDLWSPQHVLTINESHSFKLATIKGEFIWHSHPNTDEVFYCVSGGPLVIEIATNPDSKHEQDGYERVELKVGDLFNVPKAYRHRPVAENETGIMMVEMVGTVNTGDEQNSDAGQRLTKLVDES